ncbi:MAG: RluA family pseudouridine synthase [Magnetococcales bacterium]|nr:RluA family pseudouridine synthase [Magnetococcales bacterium]
MLLHSTPAVVGERVDKALALLDPSLSRTAVQRLIAAGAVFRHAAAQAADVPSPQAALPVQEATEKVRSGEWFELLIPAAVPLEVVAEAVLLSVVYEDDDLLVVNKPAGMTVHPGAGPSAWGGTLVNALLHHCRGSLSGIGGVIRPGIVHRLDKETSGLLVVAKNDRTHQHLSEQFKAHSTSRQYWAVVRGRPQPAQGEIHAPIGRHPKERQKMAVVPKGRHAVTHYRLLESFPAFSLLACRLETGRTHQIRVHMAHKGHPLLGDPVYGRPFTPPNSWPAPLRDSVTAFNRQALHAARLGFTHPATGQRLHFEVEAPADFQQLLATLRQLSTLPS